MPHAPGRSAATAPTRSSTSTQGETDGNENPAHPAWQQEAPVLSRRGGEHSTAPRDGRFIEQLGHYDPTQNPAVINLKLDKIETWVRRGALPTPTVARLMKKAGWKGLSPAAAKSSTAAEG